MSDSAPLLLSCLLQDLLCGSGAAGPAHLSGPAPAGRYSDPGLSEPGPQLCPALPHFPARRPGGRGGGASYGPSPGGAERGEHDGPAAGPHAVSPVVLSDPVSAVLHGASYCFAGRSNHLPQPGGLRSLPPLDRLLFLTWHVQLHVDTGFSFSVAMEMLGLEKDVYFFCQFIIVPLIFCFL